MCCPYFDPVAPLIRGIGPENAMLPLGDAWAGFCRAVPGESWQPDSATLRPLCNLGYAGGNCARFPSSDGPDAVRFAVSGDDGATVRLYYVMERNHHPFGHGPLEYPVQSGREDCPTLLARQAGAYASSYLRRKRESSGDAG